MTEIQAEYMRIMKKVIAFDLETIANKSIIPLLPPVEPAGNLKDPIKIKADIKKKEADRLSKLGLDPTTGRICCFGWHDGKESHHIILAEESDAAEAKLIQGAWEILSEGEHFVTFNGISFDVPFLLMRSLINRVRPSVNVSTKKYTITNHTDCRAVLNNWDNYGKGTLGFFSELLLGKSSKEDLSGDMVQDAWDMELFEDIGKYCEADCEATYQIYELLTQYYL
uniref:Putative DNA polymerase n=1 Tax=viral metagenome TaxID=1070528 RepID=A0A6M3K5X5_9ZZZZ